MAVPVAALYSCTSQSAELSPGAVPRVEFLGSFVWHQPDSDFGGFSDIHVKADGTGFIVLSDRATMRWGKLHRDPAGRIDAIAVEGQTRLRDSEGKALQPGYLGDSEGMAVDARNRIHISYEGLTRIVRHDDPTAPAKVLPHPPEFRTMQRNSSLEALALLPDGTILTIPERSGALQRPFPVWRFRNGKWDQPFSIPRRGDFLIVEADIGPDGRFYVLERDFMGFLGFRTRIRRFEISGDSISNEQELLRTRPLQYDNIEGMSVWRDETGIRLTLISDDNFSRLQRTELVEYRISE